VFNKRSFKVTNSTLLDRSEKKSISGMQLQQTSKAVNDTGYILPMAVELGKASLPFGSPMLCAYSLQLKSLVADRFQPIGSA